MEHGTIEREIHVDASPEVVFEVVSSPSTCGSGGPTTRGSSPSPGAPGELVWRDADTGETKTVALAVVEVDPPQRFSFRWCFTEPDRSGQALLVTFELVPSGAGTLLRMTETGFRELGWEVAVLEEQYRDHENGWDHFLPRLGAYVARLVATP